MNNTKLKIISFLVLIVTIFSVQMWLKITVSNTFFFWTINYILIYFIIQFTVRQKKIITKNYLSYTDFSIINIYFSWLLFNTIRGGIIAENYWEWKQLINGVQSLTLPIFVYIFSIPFYINKVLNYWFKYALIIFLLLLPFLGSGAYHFYLGPVFVVGCFLPIVPKKWKFILGLLLITMLCIDLSARSQVIKSAIVLLVAIGIFFQKFISEKLIKLAHWICYISPIVLLFLGILGTFNIFQDLVSNRGEYIETKIVDGQVVEEDLSADTRTFIYKEVIESALKHDYIFWGRTPARGNDSMTFGTYGAEILKTGKYERHSNELCHTNVFTWLGLIGVILYSLIYLRSSYLAVYQSNNIYIKFLGCFIAFRWAYGWIEDQNRFDIMNIALWMMIAMGLSKQFRIMNNRQFQTWLINIFKF